MLCRPLHRRPQHLPRDGHLGRGSIGWGLEMQSKPSAVAVGMLGVQAGAYGSGSMAHSMRLAFGQGGVRHLFVGWSRCALRPVTVSSRLSSSALFQSCTGSHSVSPQRVCLSQRREERHQFRRLPLPSAPLLQLHAEVTAGGLGRAADVQPAGGCARRPLRRAAAAGAAPPSRRGHRPAHRCDSEVARTANGLLQHPVQVVL